MYNHKVKYIKCSNLAYMGLISINLKEGEIEMSIIRNFLIFVVIPITFSGLILHLLEHKIKSKGR